MLLGEGSTRLFFMRYSRWRDPLRAVERVNGGHEGDGYGLHKGRLLTSIVGPCAEGEVEEGYIGYAARCQHTQL